MRAPTAVADCPMYRIPSGRTMHAVFEACALAADRRYGRWARWPDTEGKAPSFKSRKGDKVIMHPDLSPSPLTPEQSAVAAAALLRLDDSCLVAGIYALDRWIESTGGLVPPAGGRLSALPSVRVDAAGILAAQGIRKHAHGGYEGRMKARAAEELRTIAGLYILGKEEAWGDGGVGPGGRRGRQEVEVEGPFLVLTPEDGEGSDRPFAYRVKPGDWIVPNLAGWRQTAALLPGLLRYDPARPGTRRVALRIGLYLAMQWRIQRAYRNIGQPVFVRTLLEGAHIHLPAPEQREQRKRLRRVVEGALDTMAGLRPAGPEASTHSPVPPPVIAGWRYISGGAAPGPSAFEAWLEAMIKVVPPAEILGYYARPAGASRRGGRRDPARTDAPGASRPDGTHVEM